MDDVVHDAVGEVALLGGGLVHPERQHGQRGPGLRAELDVADEPGGRDLRPEREDPDRPRQVSEREVAEVDDAGAEGVAGLLGGGAGDGDAARLGVRLEPGRDVDAVAVDVVALDDDLGGVDGHAEQDPLFGRLVGGLSGDALLERACAADGVTRGVEQREEAVAGVLDGPAAVLLDAGVQSLGAQAHQPGVREVLVRLHESAVADHVGDQDRGLAAPGGGTAASGVLGCGKRCHLALPSHA